MATDALVSALQRLIAQWRDWDSQCVVAHLPGVGCMGKAERCEMCALAISQMHLAADELEALLAVVRAPQSGVKSQLIEARNRLRDVIRQLRGGESTRMDDADQALAALDIAIGLTGMTTTTALQAPASSRPPSMEKKP